VNVAEALLKDADQNTFDSKEDRWAQPFPPLPVGDGTVDYRY
jgi:hypothetical protein